MFKNTLKTYTLMALFGALLVFFGGRFTRGIFGGNSSYVFFLFIAAAMNFVSYWWSDKIVLAMTKSRPVTEQEAPWLYNIVRQLTAKANLPMPRLYVMPASQPNAFATGRNPQHAAVAVTEGILNVLTEQELAGVLAHEISHVRNRDILVGAVAATLAAAVTMLARLELFAGMFGGGDRRDRDGAGILSIILAPMLPRTGSGLE